MVDSDEIYTLIFKSSDGPDSEDSNLDLIYSDGSLQPSILSPEDELLEAILYSLDGDHSLYSLLIRIRQAWKTYEDIALKLAELEDEDGVEDEDEDENDRYEIMTLCVNMEYRHNRIQRSISRLVEAAGAVESIKSEMITARENLLRLRQAVVNRELQSRFQGQMPRYGSSALDYPRPHWFILLPSDVDSWGFANPHTHSFRLHYVCLYEYDATIGDHRTAASSKGDALGMHLAQHPGYAIRYQDLFLAKMGFVALSFLQIFEKTLATTYYDDGMRSGSSRLSAWAPGSGHSSIELGSLVGMDIESLQQLVPPQMNIKAPVSMAQLPLFLLDVDNSDMAAGLYPTTDNGGL